MMQIDPHSLMHNDLTDGDKASSNAWDTSTHLLQLQQDNARLHAIVAHLLLKNQSLRWQLGTPLVSNTLVALAAQYARKG